MEALSTVMPHKNLENEFNSSFESKLKEMMDEGYKITSSFCGNLDNDIVSDLAYEVERKLKESGCKRTYVKRVFSLLVELIQNIYLHGKSIDNHKLCYLIVGLLDDDLVVTSGNIMDNSSVPDVKKKIEKINELDRAGLKEYYLEVLTNGKVSDKGGAGLGFITIGMKSKSKLKAIFENTFGDNSLFKFQTTIKG